MSEPHGRRRRWTDVLATAGVAALIAAVGSYVIEFSRGSQANRQGRCELAARIVEDDGLNPGLSAAIRQRTAYMAVRALERCLAE